MAKVNSQRVAEQLNCHHTDYLEPVKLEVKTPSQQGVFDWVEHTKGMRHAIGDFYEELTVAIYGGERKSYHKLEDEVTNGTMIVMPDIVDEERKHVIEVKACHSGRGCILKDAQIARYKALKQGEHADKRFYFVIYRHGLRKSQSFRGSLEDLSERLRHSTYYSIVLSADIMWKLHKSRGSLVQRNDGKGGVSPNTKIKPSTMDELFRSPNRVLRMVGLKPKYFRSSRVKSPLHFHIWDGWLPPFPILRIENKQ